MNGRVFGKTMEGRTFVLVPLSDNSMMTPYIARNTALPHGVAAPIMAPFP